MSVQILNFYTCISFNIDLAQSSALFIAVFLKLYEKKAYTYPSQIILWCIVAGIIENLAIKQFKLIS